MENIKWKKKGWTKKGGFWASNGVDSGIVRPIISSLVWLPAIGCVYFDLEHGIQHLIAPGLIFEATWRMTVWCTWWKAFVKPAPDYIMKNNTRNLGGPGNRTQVPMVLGQMTNHWANLHAFVCIMLNKYIINNQSTCWKLWKRALYLNYPITCLHLLSSSSFCL